MDRREAYAALGLSGSSSPVEIKRAFREAALWCHPDRNPGNKAAEEAFKRITAAYELLSTEGRPTVRPRVRPEHPSDAEEPPASPTREPRSHKTWSVGLKIAGLACVAMYALYSHARKPRDTDAGNGAQAASSVDGTSTSARIAHSFRATCPLTAQEIGDKLIHWCLVLELRNQSGEDLAIESFAVRVDLKRKDGKLFPLRASPRGPPATFGAGSLYFHPNESLPWIVRGVTRERVAAESVIVTSVTPP